MKKEGDRARYISPTPTPSLLHLLEVVAYKKWLKVDSRR